MVYQWTNFVAETNAWWLRRVRPVWVTGTVLYLGYFSLRYLFFGKWAVYRQNKMTEEEHIALAAENKRNWGYGAYYEPDLARSRKLLIRKVLGDQYRHAERWEDMYAVDTRPLEEQLEEENNWE